MSMIRTAMSPAKVRSGSPSRSCLSERSLIQKSLSRQPTNPHATAPNPNGESELLPANITILNAPSELLGCLFLGRGDFLRRGGFQQWRFCFGRHRILALLFATKFEN